jgi:hypothetical protein
VSSPRRARHLVAPVLLLVTAAVQHVLVRSRDLSPWKGGGFGMFSSTDSPEARFLRLSLVLPDRAMAVALPARFAELGRRARALPSQAGLQELAESVATLSWVVDGSSCGPDEPADGCARLRPAGRLETLPVAPVAQVRVSLWRRSFDPLTWTLSAHQQYGASVTVGAPPLETLSQRSPADGPR